MQRFDLVTFDLAGEPYALELGDVREVLPPSELAPRGDAAPFVAGWASLRGDAIPVVDLRTRFELPANVYGPLLLVGDRDGRPLALRVDLVREVSRGVGGPLLPVPPYFGAARGLLRGLLDDGPRPTAVLDAAALLSAEESDALEGADRPTPPWRTGVDSADDGAGSSVASSSGARR